jgi:hypothetical protein
MIETLNPSPELKSMGRGRKPLPEGERTELVNVRLKPVVNQRVKVICFRRSVHRGKPVSEAAFLSGLILKCPLPSPPSEKQMDDYIASLKPTKRDQAREARAIKLKPLSRKRT